MQNKNVSIYMFILVCPIALMTTTLKLHELHTFM